MDELTKIIISSVFGFIGVMVGAFITRWMAKRDDATNLSLRLFDEWNSVSMIEIRHQVQEYRDFFDRNRATSLDKTFRSTDPERRAQIWMIIRFYDKLYVMILHNQVNKKLIPELFGDSFYWWFTNCFDAKLLPSGDRIEAIRIKSLMEWFEKNTPLEIQNRWKQRELVTTKKI